MNAYEIRMKRKADMEKIIAENPGASMIVA